jgi:predicted DNA-binding ribbon-helix-helix protein
MSSTGRDESVKAVRNGRASTSTTGATRQTKHYGDEMNSTAIKRSTIIKRSIVISGHKTSISVEDTFWISLKEIARTEGTTLSQLVVSIDAQRTEGANLSSAIRVFILARFKDLAQTLARATPVPGSAVQPSGVVAMPKD